MKAKQLKFQFELKCPKMEEKLLEAKQDVWKAASKWQKCHESEREVEWGRERIFTLRTRRSAWTLNCIFQSLVLSPPHPNCAPEMVKKTPCVPCAAGCKGIYSKFLTSLPHSMCST